MVFKECVGELCAAHGGPVGVSSGTPGVEVHGLLYLGDFVHYYAGAAEVVFEDIVFCFGGLGAAAVEHLFYHDIAEGAFPFFAAVGVGDLLYRAYVKCVGNTAVSGVGVGAAIAASVWPIFKFNFVAAFDDLAGFIKAGVADGSAIAANIVAIGVIGVAVSSGAGDRMGAGCACAVAVTAHIGLVGDIADGVVVVRQATANRRESSL